MKVILRKSDAAEPFSFSFVSDTGKMLVRSENYAARKSAVAGIESVRKNSTDQARYERLEAKNGKLYFNLKAANGQVVATSALFDDAAARDGAIQALGAGAAGAALDDRTG